MEELSPRARAKRRQITDAGRALFLSQGFARTSMDAVTAEAGVSKQTLYAYFASKDELLIAILAESLQTLGEQPDDHAPGSRDELRATLIGFSQRILGTMLREESIAILRLLVGEAVHVPELRHTFLEVLPYQLLSRAAAILTSAADHDVIVLDHPDDSVRMLVGPLMSYVVFGGLMSNEAPRHPSPDTVEWLVDAYLRTLDFGGSP
ncbi:MAG: TetR/AcrR family transcriptional regulator [Tessaracoccus sp.]|uniref:TetR/AcrR family transcriptional regulator n=1 Tax=Tessaracoccus sp. TaxID=1971211 RepID=UPI001EB54A70|nr:TetR/AcrR family transcriptional regulator [Tessaracoccus sp.]MBK7819497.1 TetR/AcrR family transcriptional regulator [Tessaracoccus sp.]